MSDTQEHPAVCYRFNNNNQDTPPNVLFHHFVPKGSDARGDVPQVYCEQCGKVLDLGERNK
jgi:hypothetical protein